MLVVRDPSKVTDLAARGLQVRKADYDQPATLEEALRGADKLLFISGSEVGQRVSQHKAVIDAAKKAGVKLLAYTSILHGPKNTLALAAEHQATEAEIHASGVPYVLLRNGWYIENYTANLAPALQHGAIVGSAGNGRIAAATRADYAAAAVRVLTTPGHENKVYELAGDQPFTMAQLAEEVSRAVGRTIVYKDLPPEQYTAVLVSAGLPQPAAAVYADADVGVSRGELDDDSHQLSKLIGRPTTPLKDAVGAAVKK